MNTTRFTILGALAASLLLLTVPACDDKKADDKAEAKAKTKTEPKTEPKDEGAQEKDGEDKLEAKAEDAKPEVAEGGAEAAGEAPVGVPVCDEYLAKYAACINEHGPQDSRKQMNELLAKSAQRFKAQSAGPEKDSLEQACKAMLDAAKKTTKGWGCTYE